MGRERGFIKRAPRIDLDRSAVLVDSAGTQQAVTVVDVSSGGFRLEVTEAPRIGEFVTMRIDRAEPIEAQIRWALGNEAGGVFLTPAEFPEWGTEQE